MKVIQMPDLLANKIAAGEVVERPASVVKELVENSIDARSTWIKVDVEEAGLKEIKVTDDGDGMSEADCEAAFLRHATSKIKTETDLVHVKTLGFRGEALASIASVSRLRIRTSLGNEAGTELALEGGKVIARSKSDARKGSEIIVSDLFFNTPARLKYMKTIYTELGHITDLINRLALAHPDIRFEVTHNGKTLVKTSGTGDLLQVIAQIYGVKVARKMLPVQEQSLDFSITGYIAKPEITRASKAYISTVINGRYVKSIPVTQAIIRAYHTLLPIGRFPIVVLDIRMDPILVDVNVHPTKLEVRFSKEKELINMIEASLKAMLRETTLIPEMERKVPKPKTTMQDSMKFDTPKPYEYEPSDHLNKVYENQDYVTHNEQSDLVTSDVLPELNMSNNLSKMNDTDLSFVRQHRFDQQIKNNDEQRVPTMYPIGQLHGTYIMAQNDTGLYMVDQHAAQERIKYEFYKQKLGKPNNTSQELLIPITFEFSKKEAIFIEQHKTKLEDVGLFFEAFGNQTYIVRSHPTWFPKGLEEDVIRDMVEQIIKEERVDVESLREEVAILMSCKRSIKANHYLNNEDMFRLLEDLRQTTNPFTCPHGRPIIVHFSSYELEKMFKRVM